MPKQPTAGPTAISQGAPRSSERWPKSGWITELECGGGFHEFLVQRGDVTRERGEQRARRGTDQDDSGFATRFERAKDVSRLSLRAREERHAALHGAHGERGIKDERDALG